MKKQLKEELFERYLTEEEQREEDEIIERYIASTPTIGHYNPITGKVEYTKEEWEELVSNWEWEDD